MGSTVMIFGIGALGGWVLEFLARRVGIGTIIACDIKEDWARVKTECAAIGAGAEGYYKTLKFEQCDVLNVDATAELIDKYKPDLIYSNVTLMPWTTSIYLQPAVGEEFSKIVLSGVPMNLAPISMLMQAAKKAGSTAVCLNNSLPDIINPMLWRGGMHVLVGAGNVDNLVNEIRRKVSVKENVPIRDVTVYLICEHVITGLGTRTGVPYYLKIMIGDKNVTNKYDADALISDRPHRVGRPDWFNFVMNPEVAASTVKNIMAIVNDTNEFTHSPGPNGLIGGYPLRIGAKGVEVVLPEEMTMEEATKINTGSLKYEGIEEIKSDGTAVATDEAYEEMKRVFGVECKEVRVADASDWAKEFLAAYKKLGDKYHVPVG